MTETEELRRRIMEVLTYDPETGMFRWKVKINPACKDGWFPGRNDGKGHRTIDLFNRRYQAHHLSWFISHGELPENEVDHENGDGFDNRLSNLKLATHQQNMKNCKLRKTNKTGVNGIVFEKRKWVAYISVNGKTKRLGTFATKEEAAESRQKANLEHEYHHNHGMKR